jgi:hypothetical protein
MPSMGSGMQQSSLSLMGLVLEKFMGEIGATAAVWTAVFKLVDIFGNKTAVVEDRSRIFWTDGSFNSEAGIVIKS